MPGKNLTGVPIQPSIWSDLGLGEKDKEKELTEEEKKRRKKMLAASKDLLPESRPVRGSGPATPWDIGTPPGLNPSIFGR
jgi:hypothetical protein